MQYAPIIVHLGILVFLVFNRPLMNIVQQQHTGKSAVFPNISTTANVIIIQQNIVCFWSISSITIVPNKSNCASLTVLVSYLKVSYQFSHNFFSLYLWCCSVILCRKFRFWGNVKKNRYFIGIIRNSVTFAPVAM